MPEHEQQAERPREEVDEEHPATVIELKAAAEEAAEPAAGERGADADAANGAPARTGGTEPDGASKASLSLTKSADTAAVAPDAPQPHAPQPQAPESVAGAADGTATESREQRELWAPPNPAERSPGPAPYGAQPLGAVPGGYAAPPAPYGLGSPYAAAAPLTSPAPASPVPPPPIGPDGPGPAPAGPPARYGQASGPSPYGVYHAGPVPPPYGPSAAQPPLPYGPGYGAGAPGYPAPYAHGWGWPTGLRNGMGDASLALGIIGLVLFLAFPLAMILGVLALIFGGIGHARARRGEAGNRGQALAGMICGGVALVLGALVLALVVSTAGEDADGHVDEGGYSATSVR